MDLVRDLISLGRNAREEAKIKVRQPISEVILDGKNEEILEGLKDLISEELNVKKITYAKDLSLYMNFTVKPNFKEAGKVIGSKMKEFVAFLSNLSEEEIASVREGKPLTFDGIEIDSSLLDVRVSSKEGFDVALLNNNFVILNTTLTSDLINEGYAREIVSKVQNLRKEKDFNIEDRINLYFNGLDDVFNSFESYIKKETLAVNLDHKDSLDNKFDINGVEVYLDVEKI